MLAIAAMAFATLAPLAMAAEGDSDKDDDVGVRQPTMRELANKIDSAVRDIRGVQTTVGDLQSKLDALSTTVRTLSSTVTANHATIVGKFAPQMAVVMTAPTATLGPNNATYYLAGESTIAGFPAGTVAENGQFTDRTLPAGTYLFELQQPYSDNAICHRSVSVRWNRSDHTRRHYAGCPRLFMVTTVGGAFARLDNGFGIYTFTAPTTFRAQHRFPDGLTFTDDKPLVDYTGAIRITKLK